MKIQEQVINNESGTEYWNVFFQFQTKKPLTIKEWESINNQIKEFINDFKTIKSN